MSGLDAYEKRADSRGQEGSPTRARRLGPLFALVLASGAGAAEPETAPPEAPAATVYATATVRERPVASATAAVTVVDREAIEALGAETVADVLAFVPGVTLESAGTRGGLTTARIRGGDPNFTLVLLDGVPLNDGTYPVGEVFDLGALPAAAVERIEVVRGPLSAFYGSTGLAGAVHVITRSGGSGGFRGEVEAAAGDAGLHRLEAGLSGGGTGNAAYFLGFTHDQEEGRIARESFSLDHLQGRLDLRLGEGSGLRLAGRAAGWATDDYPEASGGPVLGTGELRRGDHGEASLGAELLVRRPGERLYKLTAAVYRHEMDRESPAVPPLVPPSAEATRFTRGRLGGALSVTPAPGWTVSFGADLEHEQGETDSILLLPPEAGGALPGDYLLSRTSAGFYTEVIVERTALGPLVAELGLRADFPEGASEQASPRLGVSWRPGDGPTRLRASAGRAFKLPSFFALASPPALGGNPELEPETMVGGDLGVERELGATASASVTAFAHRFENLVDFDFETFSHVNRAEVEARGVEAAWGWRPRPGLALAADVTWQDVEDAGTGEPLRHRPRWSGGGRLSLRPRSGLDLHLDARLVSESLDEQIPVPERREVEAYALLGLRAAWRARPLWRLEARIDNLADEEYETMIGFPGAGRSGWLGLRRTFGGPEGGTP